MLVRLIGEQYRINTSAASEAFVHS